MSRPPEKPSAWRLLSDPELDGASNMARDEVLLEGYLDDTASERSPTLRFYGWRPAALSLGKGQSVERSCDRDFLRRESIDLVRRPTGGAAVLHEFERTYSLTARLDRPPFDRGVVRGYAEIAAALAFGFARLGLTVGDAGPAPRRAAAVDPVCFGALSSHELSVDARKLVGSAQVRRRRAFLQHGSILLRADARRLSAAVGAPADAAAFIDLERALGRVPPTEELQRCLVAGFERHFAMRASEDDWSLTERVRAERLRAEKYLSTAWTLDARGGG